MTSMERYKIEAEENWEEWIKDIPEIAFKAHWKVKVIPPFRGAMVRFIVLSGGESASVYLDCYDNLGYYGKPYWEVYPVDDDVGRVAMEDVEGLLKLISCSLEE